MFLYTMLFKGPHLSNEGLIVLCRLYMVVQFSSWLVVYPAEHAFAIRCTAVRHTLTHKDLFTSVYKV